MWCGNKCTEGNVVCPLFAYLSADEALAQGDLENLHCIRGRYLHKIAGHQRPGVDAAFVRLNLDRVGCDPIHSLLDLALLFFVNAIARTAPNIAPGITPDTAPPKPAMPKNDPITPPTIIGTR
jgi:hypothetical protein